MSQLAYMADFFTFIRLRLFIVVLLLSNSVLLLPAQAKDGGHSDTQIQARKPVWSEQGFLSVKADESVALSKARAKVKQVLIDMVKVSLEQRKRYEQELNTIGISDLFDPARVKQDTDLAESKVILVQAYKIMHKYRNDTENLNARMEAVIVHADLDKALKQEMLLGFKKGTRENAQKVAYLWELEEQILGQYVKMFELLAANPTTWTVKQNKFAFQYQADADLFNAYLMTTKSFIKQQDTMQASSVDLLKAAFKTIGE